MALGQWHRIREGWSARLDESRIRLARPEALLPLALLGLLTGLLAGGVIVLFRLFVEGLQDGLLPGQGAENYEALPSWGRLLFPVLGGVLLAVMFRWFAGGAHMLGVARVMERMAYHQGRCTPRAFLLQFFGAAAAIVGGHSVGREGPHVFLGASAGSLLGQRLSLPHNVIRALVGCGTAAGIAASFNTPLAGVVFALEVVMMEYSVASFIPVILAAVSATTLARAVFGEHPAFNVPLFEMGSLSDLFLVVALGVLAGAASAAFIRAVQSIAARSRAIAIWWRMLLAGAFVGVVGLWLPQVMGIGYDTVDVALHGGLAIGVLGMLLIGKLVATSVCIGLGVPGGLIGPALFAGAMLGALVAKMALLLPLVPDSQAGFFALLGMGAMMSGSLQAPLAALMAMLELTDNPEIILPGMLAVVVAGITASEVFGTQSLFVTMLRANGLDYAASPVFQALRRIGVASVMERGFERVERRVARMEAQAILEKAPAYLVIGSGDEPLVLMPAAALARYLESSGGDSGATETISLMDIPGERLQTGRVNLQANLEEASKIFEQEAVDALLVERMSAPGILRVYGVLTPDMIERAYR